MNRGIIDELKKIVGAEYVLDSFTDRLLYGYDASLSSGIPDVVVIPENTDQVSKVVSLAHREGIAVVGRGSGTNLSGGTVPVEGGIVVHFSRMNRILEIDTINRSVLVEPGVITLELQNTLKAYGYTYAPDPASQKVSTLGGNVAENAGGPHCLKYGVTTNHVLGLEIVLSDGSVLWTGGKCQEYMGYDLKGLLVGSEGTLALITKLLLKIIPLAEATKTFLAIFESIEDASNTVSDIISEGIIPATLEMMDKVVIEAVEGAMGAGYPLDAEAVLIIELEGLKDGMERQSEKILRICKKNRAREIRLAKDERERESLWKGRKGAFGAITRLRPSYLVCDGTVPRVKLPEVLSQILDIGKRYGLLIGNVFHAGDGNLHPLILFDERDSEECSRVRMASKEILKICKEAGGTISGEHGIGIEKLEEMNLIFSKDELKDMKKIKRAFDPSGIFNPGKVLPDGKGSLGI